MCKPHFNNLCGNGKVVDRKGNEGKHRANSRIFYDGDLDAEGIRRLSECVSNYFGDEAAKTLTHLEKGDTIIL